MNAALVEIVGGVGVALVTGLASSYVTVARLRVHLHYHKETLDRHDREITDLQRQVSAARSVG